MRPLFPGQYIFSKLAAPPTTPLFSKIKKYCIRALLPQTCFLPSGLKQTSKYIFWVSLLRCQYVGYKVILISQLMEQNTPTMINFQYGKCTKAKHVQFQWLSWNVPRPLNTKKKKLNGLYTDIKLVCLSLLSLSIFLLSGRKALKITSISDATLIFQQKESHKIYTIKKKISHQGYQRFALRLSRFPL